MIDVAKLKKNTSQTNRLYSGLVCFVVMSTVPGCSQIPNAVNPVEWYKSSIDFFSGQEREGSDLDEQRKFPDMSSIDKQIQQNEQRAEGLKPDVAGRQYAPQIARQGEAVNALDIAPARPTNQISALPVEPVITKTDRLPASKEISKPEVNVIASVESDVEAPSLEVKDANNNDGRMRLVKQLTEIKNMANQKLRLPVFSDQSYRAQSGQTIVVSSNGIESERGGALRKYESVRRTEYQNVLPVASNSVGKSGDEIKVATILFANSSAALSKQDRSIIASVRQLQKERGGKIRIVGHASSRTKDTDSVSHKMINLKVSVARAEAVARELIRMGLDKTKLQVDAVSDSTPVFHEYMPSGEAGNRRAEIFLKS